MLGFVGVFIIVFIGYQARNIGRYIWHPMYRRLTGKRTVNGVIAMYGAQAERRLRSSLRKAGFDSLPARLALLAFKLLYDTLEHALKPFHSW